MNTLQTLLTFNFPVRKATASVAIEPRRDRGANNQRLPVSEAALVAFAVPIAGQLPEAHETLTPTRDGEGVLGGLPCGQVRRGVK